MLLILIGSKQVGKDTFAKVLIDKYDFSRHAFADALKKELLVTFEKPDAIDGYSLVQFLVNPLFKEQEIPWLGITGRKLMQTWGNYRRKGNPLYWIATTITGINKELYSDPSTRVVVTDTRYENELASLKKWYSDYFPDKIVVVKITRPGYEGDNHISEELARKEELEVDYIIENNSTREDFIQKATEFGNYIITENNVRDAVKVDGELKNV